MGKQAQKEYLYLCWPYQQHT